MIARTKVKKKSAAAKLKNKFVENIINSNKANAKIMDTRLNQDNVFKS